MWEISGHAMHVLPNDYACRHLLRPVMSRKNAGIMVVYDKSKMSSLEEMEYCEEALRELKQECDIPIMLVGNKCDEIEVRHDKELDNRIIEEYKERLSCDIVMETSAKYDHNVEQAFVTLVAMCKQRIDKI